MFSRLASTFDTFAEKMQSTFQPKTSASATVLEDFDFVSDAVNDFADRIGSVLDRGGEMLSALSPKRICDSISKKVTSLFSSNKVDPMAPKVSTISRSITESVARAIQTPAAAVSAPAKGRLDDVRLEMPSLRRREVMPMGHAPGTTYGGMFRVQAAPTMSQILDRDPLTPFHQFGKASQMDETPIFHDQDAGLLDTRSMFHEAASELVEQDRYYDHLAVLNANAYRDMLPATPALDSAPQPKRMWLGTAAEVPAQAPVAPPVVFQAPRVPTARNLRVRGVDDLFDKFWMSTNAQGVAI